MWKNILKINPFVPNPSPIISRARNRIATNLANIPEDCCEIARSAFIDFLTKYAEQIKPNFKEKDSWVEVKVMIQKAKCKQLKLVIKSMIDYDEYKYTGKKEIIAAATKILEEWKKCEGNV
tara:strand:+ start:6915 stop:7277 length:363 start_codon:yes stop_codon:yes gene_type:complete